MPHTEIQTPLFPSLVKNIKPLKQDKFLNKLLYHEILVFIRVVLGTKIFIFLYFLLKGVKTVE